MSTAINYENRYNTEELRKRLILREPMTWVEQGVCRGSNADQFFPNKSNGGNGYKRVIKNFCNVCPVVTSCLNFALDNLEIGIWGGTTSTQRMAMRVKMARESKEQCQQ